MGKIGIYCVLENLVNLRSKNEKKSIKFSKILKNFLKFFPGYGM